MAASQKSLREMSCRAMESSFPLVEWQAGDMGSIAAQHIFQENRDLAYLEAHYWLKTVKKVWGYLVGLMGICFIDITNDMLRHGLGGREQFLLWPELGFNQHN